MLADCRNEVLEVLKRTVRPEFLNRIDDIIVFSPLTLEQISRIIELSLKSLERRLADRNMGLVLTDEAKAFIASEAYDPQYGARPVKRYLQKYVETEIASMIIRGQLVDGGKVIIETVKTAAYEPLQIPAIIVKNHGPFAWGKTAAESVYHAVVLEQVAYMALKTLALNPQSEMEQYVLDKHYSRKHGKNAYYCQK